MVDLLFIGGVVFFIGVKIDFDMMCCVEENFLVFVMFGYVVKSDIIIGIMWVIDFILVCVENVDCFDLIDIIFKFVVYFCSEEFGICYD